MKRAMDSVKLYHPAETKSESMENLLSYRTIRSAHMAHEAEGNDSSMKTVQAVDRAFTVIEVLAREGAMGLADLSKVVSVNKASLLRLLFTLTENGYLRRDDASGMYTLTLKPYEIAMASIKNLDKISQITSTLAELNRTCGRIAQFSVEDGDELMCLQSVGGESTFFSSSTEMGHRSPLYCTSAGKAILATYTNTQISDRWDHLGVRQLTEHTIVDLQDFLKDMAETRRRQYALDVEENEYGTYCVGTVVRGTAGQTVGAISVTGESLTAADVSSITKALLPAALRLSRIFGFLEAV